MEALVARRLADLGPGRGADRGPAVELSVDGELVRGRASDSVAEAAWCAGVAVLSRSLKYHRPRGGFCFEGHCSGCLMRVDGRPSVRTCIEPCRDGQVVRSQNALPSAQLDALGVVDLVFGDKLDHHTLMTAAAPLNRIANKVVRQLSGLGALPAAAPPSPAVGQLTPDVCVVGGGPAGLAAAIASARAGADVVLIDDQLELGGSLRAVAGGAARIARLVEDARAAGVVVVPRATAIGYFPEERVLTVASADAAWQVAAPSWIWASGGYPSNVPIVDNDRPGVMAARAVARLLRHRGVLVADRIAIVRDDSAQVAAEVDGLAAELRQAGALVRVVRASAVARVLGRDRASGVELRDGDVVEAGAVAIAAVPSPASEGPRQHGCVVELDPARGGYRVIVDGDGQTSVAGVWACGDVTGYLGPELALAHGTHVGAAACAERPRVGGVL
jgi:sarcosine oxidase subunit alpha